MNLLMMNNDLLNQGMDLLIRSGFDRDEAASDAWFLLQGLGEDRFLQGVKERISRRPVAYILGEWDFMGLTFVLDSHVLIPRPDTETLVENAITWARGHWKREERYSVLDLCTGSGCIAISLWKFLSPEYQIRMTASDLSSQALAIAKENAQKYQADIQFLQGDLFEPAGDKYHMIVSNPPYIASRVISGLDPDVKDYEPMMALDGGEDGLNFYRRIIAEAPGYLEPGGVLMMEIGDEQAADVAKLLRGGPYSGIRILKDLAGHDRVAEATIER